MPLRVASEPQGGLANQRVRLECELASLLGFSTDRQKPNLRIGNPEDLLGEHRTHVTELDEMLWARVRVCARID